MFDTSYGWYFIYCIIMTANISFHDFLPTLCCTQQNMLMSAKKPACFQILSCYFIDVRLKLLWVKFALNWTNGKEIRKGNSSGFHLPNLFNLTKRSAFARLNSLIHWHVWKQAEWINKNHHFFGNVSIYFFSLKFFS